MFMFSTQQYVKAMQHSDIHIPILCSLLGHLIGDDGKKNPPNHHDPSMLDLAATGLPRVERSRGPIHIAGKPRTSHEREKTYLLCSRKERGKNKSNVQYLLQ